MVHEGESSDATQVSTTPASLTPRVVMTMQPCSPLTDDAASAAAALQAPQAYSAKRSCTGATKVRQGHASSTAASSHS